MEMEDWVEKDLGNYLFSGSVLLSLLGGLLFSWYLLGLVSWYWGVFGIFGVIGLLFFKAQKISVSAVRRVIKVERFGFIRGMSFLIKFSDIERLSVEELKNVFGYRSLYYLNLRLKNGSSVPLYVGFFQHLFNKQEVEKKLCRLEKLIFEG